MPHTLPALCGINGCRRVTGHRGNHQQFPSEAWAFLEEKDKNKIGKSGLATPRGGAKGAYQNHVSRTNRVIIPYEKYSESPLDSFANDYVISFKPSEYFEASGQVRSVLQGSSQIAVGRNAFVLYRTQSELEQLPPLPDWQIRSMTNTHGVEVSERSRLVQDQGHYVVRIATGNGGTQVSQGPVQGIFAPEYATEEVNYLSKCILTWLIVHTDRSPYIDTQALHLRSILSAEGLGNSAFFTRKGVLLNGLTQCPLCNKIIKHEELHSLIDFEDGVAVQNATTQTAGATRSTAVNLFHVLPLVYNPLRHIPENVAWGHALCNTFLGQRECFSLAELQEANLKVAVIGAGGELETLGWISENHEMIRSDSAVWIRIVSSVASGESEAAADGELEQSEA